MREEKRRTGELSEGELIEALGMITPVELLMEFNQGNPIREPEMQLIADLQGKGLNDGVINVLFMFIVWLNQGLDHRVVWLIADDWISKNVATPSEAYSLAKKITPLNAGLRH